MKPVDVAFILAAGRGERLRPLTDKTPKPLLEYKKKPILDHILENLAPLKLKRVVINAWHLKEQISDFALQAQKKYSFEVKVSLEHELLGTGGGLKKAKPLIGTDSFLMLNGDCLWTGELENFVDRAQTAKDSLATWWMAEVHEDQSKVGVRDGALVQIGSLWKKSVPKQMGCFTGVQWIQKMDFEKLPDEGCIVRKFWIPELERGGVVRGDFEGLKSWTDIGTVERYQSL